MRVSMYRADHWLAFGLAGGIAMLRTRLADTIGFQHKLVETHVENAAQLHELVQQVASRGIESYGPRESTVQHIDDWMLHGAEGAIRILEQRQSQISNVPLDVVRLTAMRDKLNELIKNL